VDWDEGSKTKAIFRIQGDGKHWANNVDKESESVTSNKTVGGGTDCTFILYLDFNYDFLMVRRDETPRLETR
jgi:hypothetical protein